MALRLDSITQFRVDPNVLSETLLVLREFGKHYCEGLVLWVGNISGDYAEIRRIAVPDQTPLKSEHGVGYFVEADVLFTLNRRLSQAQLQLIAQVHSHPSDAYHSETDDRYAIVTANGGLSLVVPNFGNAPPDPTQWAVYRLFSGVWKELQPDEVRSTIIVSPIE
jgi:proteasome lid subunit RPN8/RPN11